MKVKEIIRKRNSSAKFVATKAVVSKVTAAADLLCSPPDLSKAQRVLFVQPHPDDNQIGAGGTMAWLKSLGVEVYELTVTDDRYAEPQSVGENFDASLALRMLISRSLFLTTLLMCATRSSFVVPGIALKFTVADAR